MQQTLVECLPKCTHHSLTNTPNVMIMGEVIHNIALFVQFQEHTIVQEPNKKN
jgi:hypothetical protein